MYAVFGIYLALVAIILITKEHIDHKSVNKISAICLLVSGVIFLIPLAQAFLRLLLACWGTLQIFIRKTKVAASPTSTAEDGSSIV